MTYILLHKNVPVITFSFSYIQTPFLKVEEVINESHLPIGCPTSSMEDMLFFLNDWWDSRLINRERRRDIVNSTYISHSLIESYYINSYGANLSDHYWIKSVNDNSSWEDINFFTNKFNEAIGSSLLSYDFTSLNDNGTFSPDLFTNGEQKKRWVIKNNVRYLFKYASSPSYEQSFNESLTSELCRRLKFSCVKYKPIVNDKEVVNNIYSSCPIFTSENIEYVPAFFIQKVLPKNEKESSYEHLINCCKKLNMPNIEKIKDDLSKMVLIDFIMANTDRHWGNFGFIRDSASLEWIGFSPIFDTGSSLFFNVQTNDIASLYHKVPSKAFCSTQEEELKLFSSRLLKLDINFASINNIDKYYRDLSSRNTHFSKQRNDVLIDILMKRIKDAKKIIYTYNDVTKDFLLTIKTSKASSLEEKLKEAVLSFSKKGENEKKITESYIESIRANNKEEFLSVIEKDLSNLS